MGKKKICFPNGSEGSSPFRSTKQKKHNMIQLPGPPSDKPSQELVVKNEQGETKPVLTPEQLKELAQNDKNKFFIKNKYEK